jgi:large subunit ribosomal protein L21
MQTYAVIQISGKQYLVKEGDQIFVENVKKEANESIDLPILMKFSSDQDLEVGAPVLDGVGKAEVLENIKGDKIRVAKFKSKVRYRKVRGFRPHLSKLKIVKI